MNRARYLAIVAILVAAFVAYIMLRVPRFRYSVKEIEEARLAQAGMADIARDYFPVGAFSSSPALSDPEAQAYTSFLVAMQEEPLFSKRASAPAEAYRFTWLRVFDRPVVIRVDVDPEGRGVFTVKVTDGAGGYIPGKIARSEKRNLTQSEVSEIRSLFESSSFFELPSWSDSRGCDGAQWILEAAVGERYWMVSRWSPTSGPVLEIGLSMIKRAGGRDLQKIY